MKTLTLAAIRCSLIFTAVAALSIAYPASVQAVPTTYQYTGNPFTFAIAPYTTSDFVTAMVTLAGPLGANMPLTKVTPTAFTLTDGVQTISNLNAIFALFLFATDALGGITEWSVTARSDAPVPVISTDNGHGGQAADVGDLDFNVFGINFDNPGVWSARTAIRPS